MTALRQNEARDYSLLLPDLASDAGFLMQSCGSGAKDVNELHAHLRKDSS
jgi:hypothetical protein